MTGVEEYEEFLELVEKHGSWNIDYPMDRDRQAIAQDAVDMGTTYRAKHSETGAVLHARLNQDTPLSTAVLEQPLDADLENSESDFSSSLAGAHNRIAATSESHYVESKEDTYAVARFEVPRSYNEEELTDALGDLADISVNVDRLHKDLIRVAETWE
ncbi:hypothetical protein [Halorubrum vacuolatum]|uniref:Uncharacterized protein n=1 Tax=Halorubrum vacuolatum TaxID=63740 RepID=A0A238YEM0_HALVU|nr:hypothetical protein [Halorubrum vacuolatum]SNR69412.1 hypothetical protein SAMN06264855_14013 [Halorubrum vacuolatum]